MNPRNLQTGPEPTPQPKVPFKPRIKPSYFPLNHGCLIGILTMVSYSPHCRVVFYPLYTLNNQGPFFHCSYNFVWCASVHTMRKTHKRYKVPSSKKRLTNHLQVVISVGIVSSIGGVFYGFLKSQTKKPLIFSVLSAASFHMGANLRPETSLLMHVEHTLIPWRFKDVPKI